MLILFETSVKESIDVKTGYYLIIYYQNEKNTYIYNDDKVDMLIYEYSFYDEIEYDESKFTFTKENVHGYLKAI